MNRKDADTERPHYYSQYWIAVARQAAGLSGSVATAAPEPATERTQPAAMSDLDDDLDLAPKAAPKANKPRPQAPTRPTTTLKDLSALAALSFGEEDEGDTSPFSDEDSPEEVVSKLNRARSAPPADDGFDDDDLDVEPNEDEAASLEALSEEEDYDDEEDENDEQNLHRRTGIPRPKPARRPPPPRRTPGRDY
jgi:hypothetical protein